MTTYSDLSNLVEILKAVYGEGLTNQFKDEVTTYNQFPHSAVKPGGTGYVFGIRYARNQAVGARTESGRLPTPFTGTKDQGTIVPKFVYGTMKITGPAIELAKGAPMSFVNSLSDEMEDIYQSIVVQLNRMSHGDGFGLLGVTSAAATPVITTGTFDVVFNNDRGVQYFQAGMLVDFYDSTGATADITSCGHRVLHVHPSTKTVTFEGYKDTYLDEHPNSTIADYTNTAEAIPSGAICVAMGSRLPTHATTDTSIEMTGLEGIYDDGGSILTFENILVSAYPKWAANHIANASVNRELELDLMLQACDLNRFESGRKVDTIRLGLGQRRKYINLLLPDVRYQPGQLKGGYEQIAFAAGDGTIKMVVDPMTQPGKIYFEPDGVIEKFELTPLGWGDLDGSKMHRTTNYDTWELFLRIYTNLGVQQRNCLTKVEDLVEPSLY